MLSGGEKAKMKNIVVAIKGEYAKIGDILKVNDYQKDQKSIEGLFESNKKVFMWLAHLSTNIITGNAVLLDGFNALQESNRFSTITTRENNKVNSLIKSIEAIPSIQEELIKLVGKDTSDRERVLKDIMDELGIENPNKKKKSDKKFNSMSFDDWFND